MSLPRGTLVIVDLEPTLGHEQRGTRPWPRAPTASPSPLTPWWISCVRSTNNASAIDAGLRLYLGLEPDPG